MAETIGDDERRTRADRDLEDELDDVEAASPPDRDAESEARLRELKRRMDLGDEG